MRPAILLLTLALACGGEDSTDTGTADTSAGTATTTVAPTTGTGDPGSPSGESCPLLGLFVACDGGGTTYCDTIDGALRFGPCIAEVACDLAGPLSCDKHCELVDGVPTWIVDDACGGDSGGEADG